MLQAVGLEKKKAFAGPHGHAENLTYYYSKKKMERITCIEQDDS